MKFFTDQNIDLKKYNTLGIGSFSKYLFEPTNYNELRDAIKYYNDNKIKYFVIGNGSNIILPSNDFNGVLISLKKLNKIKIDNNILYVESGVMLPYLNKFLLSRGYTNFTWAAGIPATLGGAIYSNAGAYNFDTFYYLIKITALKDNEIITMVKEDIEYGYRNVNLKGYIILDAEFLLLKDDLEDSINIMNDNMKKKKDTQPLEHKNAGSTFKNPENNFAGALIEEAELKGLSIGGAQVSNKHANFIINRENATSDDIINLIEKVQKKVYEKHNINLELENKIIKWDEL